MDYKLYLNIIIKSFLASIYFFIIANQEYYENNKSMKKIILIIITLYAAAYSQDNEAKFQDIYEKMKEQYSSIYPRKFEAYIDGKIVQRQIDTIPAKSYTKTKDDIKLRFTFEKGYKPSLILENVDSFYRNMFSVFEGALETVGFYTLVGSYNSYSSLSKKFTFEGIEDKKNEYEITLRAKGEDKNYSVTYTVNTVSYTHLTLPTIA